MDIKDYKPHKKGFYKNRANEQKNETKRKNQGVRKRKEKKREAQGQNKTPKTDFYSLVFTIKTKNSLPFLG